MTRLVLLCMFLASFAVAQGNGSPGAAPAPSAEIKPPSATPAQPKPAPNAAVITIAGVCSSPGPSLKTPPATVPARKTTPAECKTVVSRKEFEELADALPVPPAARKQFATWYATALIMSSEAHKRGLDHGQRYEDLLRITRLQVLAQQLAHDLQEQAAKVPDQEIENYYHNNAAAYQEATLDRLYVPRTQQQEPPKDAPKESDADAKKRQADSEAAMKKEADDLRVRAAAGEDFAKLQAEGYKFANFKAAPPEVKMEKTRRTTLPPAQAAVFDLEPGTVSQVFTDPGGYFVYKLEQKDTIPLDDKVREEIRASLQKQRMQDASQTMQQSAKPTFDEAYFAAISPSPAQRPRGDAPVPMRMPAPHAPNSPSAEPK